MIELRLIHDGKNWVAEDESMSVRAPTLAALDREVARAVRQGDRHHGARTVSVRMTFDRSVIPQWIRQFSGHYFNRVVEIDLRLT